MKTLFKLWLNIILFIPKLLTRIIFSPFSTKSKTDTSSVNSDTSLSDEDKEILQAYKKDLAMTDEEREQKSLEDEKRAEERIVNKFGSIVAKKILEFVNSVSEGTMPFYRWGKSEKRIFTHKFWEKSMPWLGMTKEMLDECLAPADKVEQTASKNVITEYHYYGEYTTTHKNKRYKFRIDMENDVVVGWRNID